MKKFAGIKLISEKLANKTKISQKEAEARVKQAIELVEEILLEDHIDGIQIVDGFTLEKVVRAQREGRNPRTKEVITIPEKIALKASASKALEKKLNA